MDNILEAIAKDDNLILKEALTPLLTNRREEEIEKLATDDIEDLFLYASYVGSIRCLELLSEYGM